MDANFKLKNKERGFRDPPLASGLAYMVSSDALQAHLAECVAKSLTSEVFLYVYMSHLFLTPFVCSRLTPVGRSFMRSIRPIRNTLKDTLRLGWVLSIVHDMGSSVRMGSLTFRKGNGKHFKPLLHHVVDLAFLTRYANMDFALLSTLLPSVTQGITRVLVSYDIGCQWDKKLQMRISQYSTSATFDLSSLNYWKVVVPKFHLSGHGQNCQLRYNINFTKGAARMCGEGIESGWSQSGSMAIWTRENGPNARRAILDSHWGECNWQKLLGLRESLLNLGSRILISS